MEILDFIALILLYIIVLYKKWKKEGQKILVLKTLMYIYVSFVLYFTLMPIISNLPYIFNHPYVSMYLELFGDALAGRGDFIRQIVLNIIMMIPFGFLLPLIDKKNNLFKVVIYTFLFSFLIELIQPLLSFRTSDITDLLTNTLGGAIGYILYKIINPLIKKVYSTISGCIL